MANDAMGELDRLRKVYGELGDGELARIAEDPESLTEAAQKALAEEMQRRGLTVAAAEKLDDGSAILPQVDEAAAADERSNAFGVGVPGMVPAAGAAVEQALEPGGETRLGMTSLVSFHDGMQLSQACEALDESGISPAVHEIEGDATTGTPSRFEIWVDVKDVERGKAALRARLGLFPEAEGDELLDAESLAEVSDGVVGWYETRVEAEQAQLVLLGAGFAAKVADDEEWVAAGEPRFSVVVPTNEYGRAFDTLADHLQAEGE
jgi:hypothetical protein